MSQENVEVLRGVRYRVSLPSERTAQHRTLDERLFVRFPVLFRLFGDVWMRLTPRSGLRRLLLTRLLQRGYAAGNRRDFQVMCAGLDPGIEYRAPREGLAPDLDAVLHGHDGYLQVWRSWLDAFEDIRFEPEELLDLGDRLLVTAHLRGRGSGSGVAVSRPVFQLLEFRRGLVVRQEDFQDGSKALEAAGLRE
jgi:ketosteroid isomerase-like protein